MKGSDLTAVMPSETLRLRSGQAKGSRDILEAMRAVDSSTPQPALSMVEGPALAFWLLRSE
jgi:hypothetical protein